MALRHACSKCGALSDQKRCPKHRHKDTRPNSRLRGYTKEWERTRAAYLAQFPDCQHQGCLEPATQVDHIDGKGPLGPKGHDWSNLRGFCASHHSQRTARDQPGGWNA